MTLVPRDQSFPVDGTKNSEEEHFGWREFVASVAGLPLFMWLVEVHIGAAYFIKAAIEDAETVSSLMWSGSLWLWLAAISPAALSALLWLLWSR